MASPVLELPNLAEPVTFTGHDAERFLAELPAKLSRGEEARLREIVRGAAAGERQNETPAVWPASRGGCTGTVPGPSPRS
jgi:hypothetical protein